VWPSLLTPKEKMQREHKPPWRKKCHHRHVACPEEEQLPLSLSPISGTLQSHLWTLATSLMGEQCRFPGGGLVAAVV